jgi:hypothetical protein
MIFPMQLWSTNYGVTGKFQHSIYLITPAEMRLTAARRRFHVTAFQTGRIAPREGSLRKWIPLRRISVSFWTGKCLNNSCSTDFSAGFPVTSGSISARRIPSFT